MANVNFKKGLYFNGYEFFSYNDLAEFLIEFFPNCIRLVKDNSLFELIKEGDEDLYIDLYEKTKEYKYCENVLTYIIYRLSSSPKFITSNHKFSTTYDMALTMKRIYPEVDNDINILLKDNVLSTIFWDEYIFTNDTRHKRNHDFLTSVEENHEYLFSYYYFLILHLPANDNISFVLNNVKFSTLDELISYLYTNKTYVKQIIEEIKRHDYALGLLASKTSINSVMLAMKNDNYLDFLCLINSMNQNNELNTYDFTLFLDNKMSVWLAKHYHNYEYVSNKSKKLLREYSSIIKRNNLSFNEQFEEVKKLENLYQKFIFLYKSNKIVERKQEIIPISEEYHLGYIYNNEVVCSKYLHDYELSQTDIKTSEYILAEEKNLIINELDTYSVLLDKNNNKLENYYASFEKERYNNIFFKTLSLLTYSLFISTGCLFILLNAINFISTTEKFFTNIFSVISIVLLVISLIFIIPEYNKLALIKDFKNKYNKLNKKINKTKIKVTHLSLDTQSDDIVKKRIKINFSNSISKFCDNCSKNEKKSFKIKQFNFDVLFKITICFSFLPAIIYFNKIIFNILKIELTYPLVKQFGIIYLLLTFLNIGSVSLKKPYRNTFFLFLISSVITFVINML